MVRIPLSRRHVTDVLMWLHNKKGLFSVRSGYHIAKMIVKEEYGLMESSNRGGQGEVWQKLWRCHLPNKIKVFAWRVCHDILPTKENLGRRKIVDNRSCEMCKQGDESVLHVLWECGVAQDVWAGSKLCMQKCTTFRTHFFTLVEDLMERLQVEDLEYFFVQCWVLWNQRNSVVHGGCIQDPSRLVQHAKDFIQEFRDA